MHMGLEELLESLPEEEVADILSSPLRFSEAFFVTPTTLEPFRANYVQRQILSSEHNFNVIRVHRRAGKSYAFSILALYYCLVRRNTEVLVICPDGSKVATIFDKIRDFINANDWIQGYKDEDSKSLPQRISFKNGSRIAGFTTAAKMKGEATSIRSQGADIVLIDEAAYLGEGDWGALNAITTGDEYRRFDVRVFVASTPAGTRGRYYELCKNPAMKTVWYEIFVPLDKNPDISKNRYDMILASCPTEAEFRKEFLAEFPELGAGVFAKTFVDRASKSFEYSESLARAVEEGNAGIEAPIRTMGVDWDKYNKDGHGSTISIIEMIGENRYRLVYKEEIPQSRFTLSNAIRRVIELNDIFKPRWIYLDKGYGESQWEELQKYGMALPKTGLSKKVIGVAFNQSIEVSMPAGGKQKKMFKQAMIGLLTSWFEREQIEISAKDMRFRSDLTEYHVVSQTEHTIKYSGENDHGIASLGLAAMAMHHKVKNPYAPPPATKSYVVQTPVAVPREERRRPVRGRGIQSILDEPEPFNSVFGRASIADNPSQGFSRRGLGGGLPVERSKF